MMTALQSPDPELQRYEARIELRAAWAYPGVVDAAPPWVDRNWIAWDDDPARPGPMLLVCDAANQVIGRCRKGDWVTLQIVKDRDGVSHPRLEVLTAQEFDRIWRRK